MKYNTKTFEIDWESWEKYTHKTIAPGLTPITVDEGWDGIVEEIIPRKRYGKVWLCIYETEESYRGRLDQEDTAIIEQPSGAEATEVTEEILRNG